MITITIGDHGFRTRMQTLATRLKNPSGLLMVVGREAGNRLKAHYRMKERTEPNKLGGPRTHFWRDVANAVNQPQLAGGEGVRIQISHPAIAQKIHGGVIRAKAAGALTIPLVPEAHGRRASTYEAETGFKLFVVRKPNGAFLAAAADGEIRFIYALRQSVNQDPDPTALPPEEEFSAALVARAEKYVARITQPGTTNNPT